MRSTVAAGHPCRAALLVNQNRPVLGATLLALASAVLHALWNLVAKRSPDAFLALWGQFFVAALAGAVLVSVTGGLPAAGWGWAAASGAVHLPYIVALAGAYDAGDFSVAYPLARGGGALLAGVGGVVLLGDEVNGWTMAAIITVVAGMALLAAGAQPAAVRAALFVAVTIGVYTTIDSHASREIGNDRYVFAAFVVGGCAVTAYGAATGRGTAMVAALRSRWRQFALTAAMSMLTYGLVLAAVRRAPVGYVAALRESSVLLAAFLGWRYLDEGGVRRRSVAAAVILGGLVLLVVSA
jgi:drug/metabolite transporter (DMT)-like permease